MDLKKLTEKLPYKWRVQSFSKNKAAASCVAYIDARDVQDRLDTVCWSENWQVKYEEHKGNLFASIGIKCWEGWTWKSDCGSESAVEKEKWEASDAFKRAAVMWGIGRFLYSLSIEYVDSNEKKTASNDPYVVSGGKRVWDITKLINNKK